MQEIICYTPYLSPGTEQLISFMELFLDDNWANGDVLCPEALFQEIGDINHRLTAKQNYEFLLRAAEHYSIRAIGSLGGHRECPQGYALLPASSEPENLWDSFCTDCYVTGKYQQQLLESGYFNVVVESLLTTAVQLPNSKQATDWLEKMISHAPEYYTIDDNTRPILIYRSYDPCYNILNLFAQELANAFQSCHQRIEIFDAETEGNQALTKYIGLRFKAIIGIQSYLFSIMMQDNVTKLHDLIYGPKYNMLLDHPAWMQNHIANAPNDYYLLIHDRNYLAFAQKYYKNVKGCIYFPPAGTFPTVPATNKKYDITFIGSYYDYRKRLAVIHKYTKKYRFFANRYLKILRRFPELTGEAAFQKTLDEYRLISNEKDFLNLFYEMRQVYYCVMFYYREKVIRTLLDAGIELHVYSDSWQNSPFANHKCLIQHPAVDIKESLEIMQQSRICLNIMSWHKDGLTERVLNTMLCHSIVLSDKSSTLEEQFQDGQDLVLFSLTELVKLPALVKNLLDDEARQRNIIENGYQKATSEHLWIHRAKLLLQLWNQQD